MCENIVLDSRVPPRGFVHGSLPPVSGFPAIRNYILKRRVLTVRKLMHIIRQLKIGCRLLLFPNFMPKT